MFLTTFCIYLFVDGGDKIKLFIGHFGDDKKEEWFLCWAENEDQVVEMTDGMIAEPIFIEEVENQPGFICFKVEEEGEDGKKFNIIKAHEDELFFEDYDWIEHIISQERSYSMDVDIRRIRKKNKEFMRKLKEKYGNGKK